MLKVQNKNFHKKTAPKKFLCTPELIQGSFNVFTRFYALLRAFISVKQFISLLRLQFTPLTI